MLNNAKESSIFPPEVPTCPDYWENITDKPNGKGYVEKLRKCSWKKRIM